MTTPIASVAHVLREVLGDDFDDEALFDSRTSLLYDLDLESIEILTVLLQLAERHPGADIREALGGRTLSELGELTLGDLARWLGDRMTDESTGA